MFCVQYFRECIYIGEPLVHGFSGYRVQVWRPRTVPYKRVALYHLYTSQVAGCRAPAIC